MKKIYFDNAATTPIHPKVKEKILPYLGEFYGNPSSIHSFGREIRVAVEESREVIAGFINAHPSEIYFTSGGTEADNMAISGISNTVFEETGMKKIITSKAEHHAVLETFEHLGSQGFATHFINTDNESRLKTSDLADALDNSTSLVSCIHINNETGAINNLESIVRYAHSKKALLHVDAVQSFGKFNIDVKQLGIDTLAASAHKIHGTKGIGMLYGKTGTPLAPLLHGGSQERNRRGGTENVIGIIGFAEAVKIAKENLNANYSHVADLSNYFIDGLKSLTEGTIDINSGDNFSPYVLSVTFKSEYYNNDAEAMVMFLDINGIAASNGSACTSGTLKPSHVIMAMGKSREDAAGTIRFSFSANNTVEEVDYALEVISRMKKNFGK